MAEAMVAAGHDPAQIGVDHERLARIGHFVELHIEQGRVRVDTPDGPAHGLVDVGCPVAVASAIWPHGRWRFDFTGRADHAGTTRLEDRDDPMLAYAAAVLAARDAATRHDALATFGKVRVDPNGVNAIASRVSAWLDARGADEDRVRALVADLATGLPAIHNVRQRGSGVVEESWTPLTTFDASLRDQVAGFLDDAPILPTGAGHDAGILTAAGVPSAMIFVRNPTGVSHSPHEFAEPEDCHRGVEALTKVVEALARMTTVRG
jgi:N-carbamoyl-L-amino-acid hydrolase